MMCSSLRVLVLTSVGKENVWRLSGAALHVIGCMSVRSRITRYENLVLRHCDPMILLNQPQPQPLHSTYMFDHMRDESTRTWHLDTHSSN